MYAHRVAATAVTAAVVLIVEKTLPPPPQTYTQTVHTKRNHRSHFFSFPGHPFTIKTVSARVLFYYNFKRPPRLFCKFIIIC